EGHVPGGASSDLENIWPVPAPRVAVGGGEKQQHLLAVADPNAGDADRLRRGPEKRLHRRLEAQHLLKSAADQGRVFAKNAQMLGISDKTIECVAEPVDRGIDSGGKK